MIFFLFLLGLAVGSFLNVLIDRLPRDESVIKGRSHCESCKKILAWYDLMPVLSFVLLGGKCRYCHSPISFFYPLVELVTGVMFVLTFFLLVIPLCHPELVSGSISLGFEMPKQVRHDTCINVYLELVYYLFIVSSLIVIFFTDLKYGIIPDKIVYPGVVISLLYLLIFHNSLFIIHLLSALGAFLFFLFLFLVTRGRGMGFGDVKLVFLLGLFLGFPKIMIALYFAFLTGAFWGCILILWRKKRLSETISFGPFLSAGAFISLLWGEGIIRVVLGS